MVEIKPCPFCGGDDLRLNEAILEPTLERINITCTGCNMTFIHEQHFAVSAT